MTHALLQASDVTKQFDTSDPPTVVLRGISLDVQPGEFLAIMGASGSGKSTLLYAISGMDSPTSGTVMLNDEELTAMKPAQLASLRLNHMGFVFQQAHFLENLNVRDNIALPALKAKKSVSTSASTNSWPASTSTTSPTTRFRRSRAASSSVLHCAAPWLRNRRSSSLTNPLAL
ncbi:ABC transporter ATP-binding protein [Corynebacterium breve]|uniref:ABC transporter ATP-binding protein n=1 Tax=Corynebacterium breve TaxID=3049799 RepID=A0ABY8VHQ5_9CORY|nr:ABC transporter ATP-binding protein [Corynebacterium breve]WIM67788.1 ABC transporter ATP-binding protein [Corynebacterium breve]